MQEREDDTAAIERLFCQVCDPVEYDDGIASAQVVTTELNRVLALEHLTISFWQNTPVMAKLSPDGDHVVYTAPEQLDTRLRSIITDPATADWLLARARETQVCERNGAFTFPYRNRKLR